MSTFGMVGAAVAVVNRAGVVHQQIFGVRDLASGAPVTDNTLFRVGSTTKSMTSLLVATFVDEGLLDWDQPVVKVWPDFRAPSAALTGSLRVRDLMGMATGLDEGPIALHYDEPTAIQLMKALAVLQVRTPPDTEWFYNNVVFASAGYLPLLVKGVPVEELQPAYFEVMQERVFGPIGMDGAHFGNDPRPLTDDYATGYAFDFVEGTAAVNWIPIGCIAPAGAVLATIENMAVYLRMQLGRGATPAGKRVVSQRNLEECWRPHIPVPPASLDGPDIDTTSYGMGWIEYTYKGGRRLIWHTGFWDGFGAFIGILPEDDLGLVILTNVSVGASNYFHKYVLNLLLGRFGLNRDMNEKIAAGYRDAARSLADAAAQSTPVIPTQLLLSSATTRRAIGWHLIRPACFACT
jgi:CubicO group peptidase (beta-lactamase class C family)